MSRSRSGKVALTTLKRAAAAVDGLRRIAPGVTILIYHRVGRGSTLEVDLPVELFARQMELLATSGRVVTIGEALALLERDDSPSSRPVVVTFDDGTADFADFALPVLERWQVPATLYLATGFIEEQRSFPDDGAPLSWDAVNDVLSTGLVTIGSHTHTHALLDRISDERIDEELDRSVALIGERAGIAAEHFAYPKAIAGSPRADAAVRARFRSAALAGTKANPVGGTDPWRLSRSPVQVADGMGYFRRKVDGGMALEDSVRRLVNRRRYARAVD